MGKQEHLKTGKEHVHVVNIFEGQMAANKERLKYYAKLLRIPKDIYVGLKERGKEAFWPLEEKIAEISNKIHHSLCTIFLFRIFLFLIISLTVLSCDNFV
jgi:hypothetical protein